MWAHVVMKELSLLSIIAFFFFIILNCLRQKPVISRVSERFFIAERVALQLWCVANTLEASSSTVSVDLM